MYQGGVSGAGLCWRVKEERAATRERLSLFGISSCDNKTVMKRGDEDVRSRID